MTNPGVMDNCVIVGKKGFLIIGDPLLGGDRRPGRLDNAWDVSIDKLRQSVALAQKNQWIPVIVGDLLSEGRGDLSKVLAIINILKGQRVILLPRDARWNDRASGHIAAVLQAAGVAEIAGFSAKLYQLNVAKSDGSGHEVLSLECHTPWGGAQRLEQGNRGRLVLKGLGVEVEPHSGIPDMVSGEHCTLVQAGRLIRVTPQEEKLAINVFSATPDGIQRHALQLTPVVFNDAVEHASAHQSLLSVNSRFVEQLRTSAKQAAEDEGKDGLMELLDETFNNSGVDSWVVGKCFELAKEAVMEPASAL